MVIITPAGLEDFFYSNGTPVNDISTAPAFTPVDIDRFTQLAINYPMEIVLPEQK